MVSAATIVGVRAARLRGSTPNPERRAQRQLMTEPKNAPRNGAEAVHRIVVPAEVNMVALLGARDEVLRAVERAFSRADVHVRATRSPSPARSVRSPSSSA